MFRNLNIQLPKITVFFLSTRIGSVTIRFMYATDTILTFAFPAGRLAGTRLKISLFFPVLALACMWRQDLLFGLMATGILLFSVLIHELMHLVVARSAGGDMEEMSLWPLGGLKEPFVRGHLQPHIQTMMAGPLVNLLLALSCTLTLTTDQVALLLNPFGEFLIPNGESLVTTAWRVAFLANWAVFLANLIPVSPFDSGILLRTYLSTRFSESESRDLMIRLGLVFGLLGIFTGFVFDSSALVTCAAFVLVLQIHENLRWYEITSPADEYSGYDLIEDDEDDDEASFSESWAEYNETHESDDETNADVLGRWRDQREVERQLREQEEREREEQQVDEILLKLHQGGRDSLSIGELHFLNRVSVRYRNGKLHN